ncbi:YjfI family protein [Tahibacter amnicola]|uniref:YjfI family protein n=1 Tax=Tahibacter amnicola TaxID=2976241 RepID=A0ABY6BDM5_9GAMM|nr:YjfI family protein [Tahibacter amnicola]UXI67333.1 YjfI family protein [Tahibacter amnicola]
MNNPWTTESLYEALHSDASIDLSGIDLSLVGGVDPTLSILMREHGDLALQMAVSGEQIFVSAPLCLGSQVKDRPAFNEACLRLNPLNPLSNLGLQSIDGEDLYIVFGELSARSPLQAVVEEIRVLADNTLQAAEAFAEHLK